MAMKSMEIFVTIISGVSVFIVGQLIVKLFVEPFQNYRKTVSDIAYALVVYANVYANVGLVDKALEKEASKEFRDLASRLQSYIYLLPYYQCIALLTSLPSRDSLIGVSNDLIGLSNGISASNIDLIIPNLERVEKIYTCLKIYVVKGMTASDYLSSRVTDRHTSE